MKTAFFDIDTQLDFLYPAGALYVPGAERIIPAVAKLNRFASERGIPVVSTTDAHDEDDIEFRQWPHHCIAGTTGQRKAAETLLEERVIIPDRECEIDLGGARQIIVEKRTVDVFASHNLQHVVDRLNAESFVVYGVVTEICVLFAVQGLLRMGKSVTVVTDAVETLNQADSKRALAEIQAAGGRLAAASEVLRSAL